MGNQPPGQAERDLWNLKIDAIKYVMIRNLLDSNTPLDEIPFTPTWDEMTSSERGIITEGS